jgi:hypothetical protein
MRWTSQAAAGLVAIVLAGCSGRDRSHDSGSTTGGGAGTETGAMSDTGSQSAQPGMTSDTSSGVAADTALKGTSADTASAGKESGTADSLGKAAVGKDSQQTQPSETQQAPSTADSLNPGVDSAR